MTDTAKRFTPTTVVGVSNEQRWYKLSNRILKNVSEMNWTHSVYVSFLSWEENMQIPRSRSRQGNGVGQHLGFTAIVKTATDKNGNGEMGKPETQLWQNSNRSLLTWNWPGPSWRICPGTDKHDGGGDGHYDYKNSDTIIKLQEIAGVNGGSWWWRQWLKQAVTDDWWIVFIFLLWSVCYFVDFKKYNKTDCLFQIPKIYRSVRLGA